MTVDQKLDRIFLFSLFQMILFSVVFYLTLRYQPKEMPVLIFSISTFMLGLVMLCLVKVSTKGCYLSILFSSISIPLLVGGILNYYGTTVSLINICYGLLAGIISLLVIYLLHRFCDSPRFLTILITFVLVVALTFVITFAGIKQSALLGMISVNIAMTFLDNIAFAISYQKKHPEVIYGAISYVLFAIALVVFILVISDGDVDLSAGDLSLDFGTPKKKSHVNNTTM